MNDFIKSWKIAGDEMDRLRNERLRKMDPAAGARMMGAVETPSREEIYANGLVRWQSWMNVWRIKHLAQQVGETARTLEGIPPDA